jgi:nucleoside transporter
MQSLRFKLSVMMFLQFFIWGAWLPLIFGYMPSLGFDSMQQSWILNAFAIASLVGMFFSNQFADRNFAAERFLAVSHFVGGVSILALTWITSFWPFFILMLIHSLFYVPTISITNSIAFANLTDTQKDFPRVRLWGTIGWIAASWPFVFLLIDWVKVPAFGSIGFVEWLGIALKTSKEGEALISATTWTFLTAGIASLILAAFSLTLPHTPPKKAGSAEDSFALWESLKLLKYPFIFVLFIVTFVDAAVHQCYFIWTNDYLKSVGIPANWVMPVMSIGQIAEIGTMWFLGYCLKNLGWRYTMVIGILGHAVRFAIFAFLPLEVPAVVINVLHGICYAFFFATVYIFVDDFFPKDARTSAQGLFNFLILGLGPFIANFVWPMVGDMVKTVDLTANVVKNEAALDVDITGKVKNPRLVEGKFTLHLIRNEKIVQSETAEVDATGNVKASFAKVEPGPASFEFEYMRKLAIGDRLEKTKLDFQEIKAPKSDKAEDKITAGVKQYDFQKLFLAPSLTALFAAILLLLFFHPPQKPVPESVGH